MNDRFEELDKAAAKLLLRVVIDFSIALVCLAWILS